MYFFVWVGVGCGSLVPTQVRTHIMVGEGAVPRWSKDYTKVTTYVRVYHRIGCCVRDKVCDFVHHRHGVIFNLQFFSVYTRT